MGLVNPSRVCGSTMEARTRFENGPAELAATISTFAKKASWMKYIEDKKDDKTKPKIDRKAIEKNKELIQALHKLQPNMSFRAVDVKDALKLVLKGERLFRDFK